MTQTPEKTNNSKKRSCPAAPERSKNRRVFEDESLSAKNVFIVSCSDENLSAIDNGMATFSSHEKAEKYIEHLCKTKHDAVKDEWQWTNDDEYDHICSRGSLYYSIKCATIDDQEVKKVEHSSLHTLTYDAKKGGYARIELSQRLFEHYVELVLDQEERGQQNWFIYDIDGHYIAKPIFFVGDDAEEWFVFVCRELGIEIDEEEDCAENHVHMLSYDEVKELLD